MSERTYRWTARLARLVCFLGAIGLLTGIALSSMGCTAVQTIPRKSKAERTYLRLEIEPKDTEVYVDDEYRGTVDGWVDGVVPMSPGDRRIKLEANGYITRRFDMNFEPGETITLRLEMEPKLGQFAEEDGR